MPLRLSSADILVVYLLFCLHLRITNGTTVKPDSIHQGFTHQWCNYKCCVGCCHCHPRSNVCLRRPTRQHNMPLVNAKYQSNLSEAGRQRGRSWLFHVIISQGNCSQALMKCANQSGELYLEKLGDEQKDIEAVRKTSSSVCWQCFRSRLTFHGDWREGV